MLAMEVDITFKNIHLNTVNYDDWEIESKCKKYNKKSIKQCKEDVV